MAELWDAYDQHFQKIDSLILTRGRPIPEGVYHLVCDIIVKHDDGTYLLMQRDPRKHRGGLWELSAGGAALAGETPQACAHRELMEETGIVSCGLQELERIVDAKRRCIFVLFLSLTSWEKTAVTLQEGETTAYQWADRSTILAMNEASLASVRPLRLLREGRI